MNTEQYIAAVDQLSLLKSAAADAIAEKDELVFHRSMELEREYMLKVGSLENRILSAEHELQKLKRKAEVVRTYSFDLRDSDLKMIDMQVELEYSKLGNELKNRLQKEEVILETELPVSISEEAKLRLTAVYSRLIKLLHPELNPDTDRESLLLWQRAHAAFIRRDPDDLIRIALQCAYVCEYVPDKSVSDDLVSRMERCRELIANNQSVCEKIRKEYPFTYEERLSDEGWVHRSRMVNEGMLDYLNAACKESKENLDALVEGKRANEN